MNLDKNLIVNYMRVLINLLMLLSSELIYIIQEKFIWLSKIMHHTNWPAAEMNLTYLL